MSTSEQGASAQGPGPQGQEAQEPTDEDDTLEDMAAHFVTTFVENAASAAVEMLQHTATAFEASLVTALHGEYKATCLAKDSALLWARNVQFITRLFSVGTPAELPCPPPEHEGPATTGSRVPAPEA